MDKKVLITNSLGQQMQADVITAIKLNNNQKYIVYTFNERDNDNIKTYVSKIREEGNDIYFDSISSDEEWKQVREAIMNEVID